MSFFNSTGKTTWFAHSIIHSKHLIENDELLGEIRHYENEVQQPVRGRLERRSTPPTLTTEEERMQALEYYFGINVSKLEVLRIRGMSTRFCKVINSLG